MELFQRKNAEHVLKEELHAPTGQGVRIGVIDSGWDRSLADPRIKKGVGFVDPFDELALQQSDDDHDRIGHGTACADLILQIAPNAEIFPLRVFGHRLETSVPILTVAIKWAMEHQLRVLNLSLGTHLANAIRPLYAACELARRNGLIIVAAAHASRASSYPSIFENVIGITAGHFNSPFEYSYRKNEAIECAAKGGEQMVLWLGGQKVPRQGTSFAAPHISGIVALFLERYPHARLENIRELLALYAIG
ncbi:MAG: S8/S53 family peptidase [candidate division KSB1 bacterium]|nr:S8/S53 family peptidase [candidate division KSB1 bacterium]MDZ7364771.1 S8/S53 family peptidase [candidate division KSB1 bacterium]MDZ7402481.1 S8/S53 family peptidase [candidate division KSB1 bacterium]